MNEKLPPSSTVAYTPMTVASLTVDPSTHLPVLVLKDASGRRSVPIWTGLVEASAIATELERITLDRPQTHDLMKSILTRLGARVERVEIRAIRDNTFFAAVCIRDASGGWLELDARPSDAVAMALRAGIEVHVADTVIADVREIDLGREMPKVDLRRDALMADEGRPESFEQMLMGLSPDAFGKWKM